MNEIPTCIQLAQQLEDKLDVTIGADIVYGLKFEYEQLQNRIKELEDANKALTEELCEYAIKQEKVITYVKTTNFWGIYEDVPFEETKYGDDLLEILGEEN